MSKLYKILKHINSIPFPLTMKYRYSFDKTNHLLKNGELSSPDSWDVLRLHHPHFSISTNRDEWLQASDSVIKKDGQDGALAKRANDVVSIIDRLEVTDLFSVGVGGAGLEYQIKKIKPSLHLICSEYSRVSVDILKKVFTEADSIIEFDINNPDWSIGIKNVDPKKQLCLLYRIDIGFSDDEFRKIFKNMHDSGIDNVLIIMCGRLTVLRLVNRFFEWLGFVWKSGFKKRAFSGYLRTTNIFESFWSPLYTTKELDCGGLKSFLLKRK